MTALFGKAARSAALAALALVAGGAVTGKAAHAQAIPEAARKTYAVKVGVYMPAVKEVRQASGVYNFAVELDWVAQRFPAISSQSIISLGYIEREGLRMVPLTASQIFRDPNNPSGLDYYYGLGVGIYSMRLDIPGQTSGRIKNMGGAFVVTGLNLTTDFFVEAKYHILSRYERKNVDGLQLSAGYRF